MEERCLQLEDALDDDDDVDGETEDTEDATTMDEDDAQDDDEDAGHT
jgi:hypothetical protein